MMPRQEAMKRTFSRRSVRRSLTVALIVGSALNMINQGDLLFQGEPIIVWKLLLTYFVPYAVASYGSYAALRTS